MTQTENIRSALVTGATGFVGGNLVEALLRKRYSITCLVRRTSDTRALQNLPVRLLEGDISDPAVIREIKSPIHTVYHAAATLKAADREHFSRINQLGGTKALIRLGREVLADAQPNLHRFVHISSLAAAGPSVNGRGLTENEYPNPTSWYGESKLASEHEVLRYKNTFPVTILRPSAVYGPRDSETLIIFRMIKQGCLFTPGRFTRRFNLIHVDDLTDGIIEAGERDTLSGEIFFISRFETYTWEEVGRAIACALGKKYRHVSFPKWIALAAGLAGDAWSRATGHPATISTQKIQELLKPAWLCDSSKARNSLGFNPSIELERGIKQTVEWYQNNQWL
jgi:nucleoside-diphosphate-sugar epimerase